jgi:hypothetical protein
VAFKPGNGLSQLRADLERGRDKGLQEMKRQLEARVDDPGPSDPGEYPGVDSGVFAASFFVTENGVANDAPHAIYLEFKSPSEGGRQPFSQGAADKELQAAVAKAVAEGVRNG